MKEWLYVESPEELSGTLLPLSLEPGAPEVIPEWTPACVLLLSWATTDYGGAGVRGWSPQQKPLWRGLISARATCQVGWDGTGSWGITEVGCMVLARLMESDRYSACQHQASWVIVFSNTTKKKKKWCFPALVSPEKVPPGTGLHLCPTFRLCVAFSL